MYICFLYVRGLVPKAQISRFFTLFVRAFWIMMYTCLCVCVCVCVCFFRFWVFGSQRVVHAPWRIVLRACTFLLVDAVSSYTSLQVSYFAHTHDQIKEMSFQTSRSFPFCVRTYFYAAFVSPRRSRSLTFVCFRWLFWPIFSLWSEMIFFLSFVRCDLQE